MSIALYTLTSNLHKETARPAREETFIKDIERELGEEFLYRDDDFSDFGQHGMSLVYVRTGGTEGLFKDLNLKGRISILTSGRSNSLAASMEILSYLRQQGQAGEIIHGSVSYIAGRIRKAAADHLHTAATVAGTMETDDSCPFIHPLPDIDLGGGRLGVIGKPSDWLISSNADYAKARRKLGVELVDIPMSELLDALPELPDEEMRSIRGSQAIYSGLRKLIDEYELEGLTLRCFDLLDTVHNTGCLALAKLNAEGIPSSCEGDITALLSMIYLERTTGCPGFQCNLSRIDGDEMLFAHCTVPLNMVDSYTFATHFESGIGTAIKAELPAGPVGIFKISPDLESFVSIRGQLLRCPSEQNLCRTQVIVNAPGAASYFLHSPLANHHIIHY